MKDGFAYWTGSQGIQKGLASAHLLLLLLCSRLHAFNLLQQLLLMLLTLQTSMQAKSTSRQALVRGSQLMQTPTMEPAAAI